VFLRFLVTNMVSIHYNDQSLLILCWHLFSISGSECVAFSLTYNGCQYLIYESLQPIATQISHDSRPTIVDPSLMSIWDWDQERVAFTFSYKCSLYLHNECLHPIATQITQDVRRKIVDASFTHICWMRQRVYLSNVECEGSQYMKKCQWHIIVDVLRFAIEYLLKLSVLKIWTWTTCWLPGLIANPKYIVQLIYYHKSYYIKWQWIYWMWSEPNVCWLLDILGGIM